MTRRSPGALAIAFAALAAVGLSGCAGPSAADGRRVADWIAGQPHVTRAESYVSDDPWNTFLDLTIDVDPAVSDEDLAALAQAAEQHALGAGWEEPFLTFDLGDGRSFGNLGGAPTLGVFLGIRGDDDYVVASARGNGACGGIFCVTLEKEDPGELLIEVQRMLDLAASHGGVQSNLTFTAASVDGAASVSAEPDAPVDDAVALWQHLATRVPIVSGSALGIEAVGDIPSAQILNLTVPDEATKLLLDRIAAAQSAVEIRVDTAA